MLDLSQEFALDVSEHENTFSDIFHANHFNNFLSPPSRENPVMGNEGSFASENHPLMSLDNGKVLFSEAKQI